MTPEAQHIWDLRIVGRLREVGSALDGAGQSLDTAEIALLRNSLTRARAGGAEADREFREMEECGLIGPRAGFQYHYQAAANAFADGRSADALERLLRSDRAPKRAADRLLFLTSRLVFTQRLGFPVGASLEDAVIASRELAPHINTEVLDCLSAVIESVRLRSLGSEGKFSEIFESSQKAFTQSSYYKGFIAALPYNVGDRKDAFEHALDNLTLATDFRSRGFRLQTLIGRCPQRASARTTGWSDFADRLYLWTWRWLANPSVANEQALLSVLETFESWDGRDTLSDDDLAQIHCSLGWVLLFEPERRNRWQKLLRRASALPDDPHSLYALERLWIERTRYALEGVTVPSELELAIAMHPISKRNEISFASVAARLTPPARAAQESFRIHPDCGQIYFGGRLRARSQSLAGLISALVPTGSLSFGQAMASCFGIHDYDPFTHDSKVQNLVVRLRRLLGTHGHVSTREGWIFLEANRDSFVIGRPNRGRPRLCFSSAKQHEGTRMIERARNERSLSILLREADSLAGAEFSRLELESRLRIPKPTLNRYLRLWTERGWIQKSGSGPRVTYRVTLA